MEISSRQRPRGEPRRTQRFALVLGACTATFALAMPAIAQSLSERSSRAVSHEDNPKRARTVRPDRGESLEPRREYDADSESSTFTDEQGDIPFLEGRIRDLTAKVRELGDLLKQQKEALGQVRFTPRPQRVTLLEKDRPPRIAKTYGEAVESFVRERVRIVSSALVDPEQKGRFAIEPDPAEVRHLLGPIYEGLAATGTREEIVTARVRSIVYLTLLEARAKIDPPEPLPALYKVLRDLHVDRTALTEHLRRSFLLDNPTVSRDLGSVLAATAAMYPEPPAARDFLAWLADGIGADLKDEAVIKSAYPYRGDPAGQFDAAAENANLDNGDVIKLQVELQRLHAEARTLRANNRKDPAEIEAWKYRLVQAERELDRLLKSADVEREAVMTLARRVPVVPEPRAVAEPVPDLISSDPADEVAADDLSTQH